MFVTVVSSYIQRTVKKNPLGNKSQGTTSRTPITVEVQAE